jgi:hypothetical protein
MGMLLDWKDLMSELYDEWVLGMVFVACGSKA